MLLLFKYSIQRWHLFYSSNSGPSLTSPESYRPMSKIARKQSLQQSQTPRGRKHLESGSSSIRSLSSTSAKRRPSTAVAVMRGRSQSVVLTKSPTIILPTVSRPTSRSRPTSPTTKRPPSRAEVLSKTGKKKTKAKKKRIQASGSLDTTLSSNEGQLVTPVKKSIKRVRPKT